MPHSDVPQKNTNLGKPIDPSRNPQAAMGDTYGLTGITADQEDADEDKDQDLQDALVIDITSDDPTNMLSINSDTVQMKAANIRRSQRTDSTDELLLEELDDASNDTIYDGVSPSILGEQSVSGDMADPESDDDMLLNSHQMGLRLDEDEDNPQELNIAADIAAAERSRRGMDNDSDDDDDDL